MGLNQRMGRALFEASFNQVEMEASAIDKSVILDNGSVQVDDQCKVTVTNGARSVIYPVAPFPR